MNDTRGVDGAIEGRILDSISYLGIRLRQAVFVLRTIEPWVQVYVKIGLDRSLSVCVRGDEPDDAMAPLDAMSLREAVAIRKALVHIVQAADCIVAKSRAPDGMRPGTYLIRGVEPADASRERLAFMALLPTFYKVGCLAARSLHKDLDPLAHYTYLSFYRIQINA